MSRGGDEWQSEVWRLLGERKEMRGTEIMDNMWAKVTLHDIMQKIRSNKIHVHLGAS